MMPEASDNGSQPYRNAVRCFEMAGAKVAPLISSCPWVGDMCCSCPLPTARFRVCGVALTSHFAVPKGTAVWLATFVRCLWHPFLANRPLYAAQRHPLCKRPNCIFSLVTAPCMLPNDILFTDWPYPMPLASFSIGHC